MGFAGSRLGFWYLDPDPPVEPIFVNCDFELGFTDWVVEDRRIYLNGGSTVAGWPTPTDPTPAPGGVTDGKSFRVGPSFSHQLTTVTPSGSGQAAQLSCGGTFSSTPGIIC